MAFWGWFHASTLLNIMYIRSKHTLCYCRVYTPKVDELCCVKIVALWGVTEMEGEWFCPPMIPLEPIDPSLGLVPSLHTPHRCPPLPADAKLCSVFFWEWSPWKEKGGTVYACIILHHHCGWSCFIMLRDWNSFSLILQTASQRSWPSSHSWSSGPGLVQRVAWFNISSNKLRLTWPYCGGGSRVPNQGMLKRHPDPTSKRRTVCQTYQTECSCFFRLLVFGSIQNLAWPYMFYKLLLNYLSNLYSFVSCSGWFSARQTHQTLLFLLMFMTWRCAFGFSTTHLIQRFQAWLMHHV